MVNPLTVLRHVETSVAERTVKYQKFSMIVIAVAVAGEVVNAILQHTLAGHVVFALVALMFIGVFFYQRTVVSGARRYLAAVQS